jgi:hypothetical protein
MKIRTLKKSEYRGCPIYIRNLGNIFEYLAIVRNEVYSANIIVIRRPLQRIFGKDYTPKQLADAVSYTLKMSEATIDLILGDSKK